jgi:hypothetical protein
MILPQFDLSNFLSTSIFMWIFFIILYIICKKLFINYIHKELSENLNILKNLQHHNQHTINQLEIIKKETVHINHNLQKELLSKKIEMAKEKENILNNKKKEIADIYKQNIEEFISITQKKVSEKKIHQILLKYLLGVK